MKKFMLMIFAVVAISSFFPKEAEAACRNIRTAYNCECLAPGGTGWVQSFYFCVKRLKDVCYGNCYIKNTVTGKKRFVYCYEEEPPAEGCICGELGENEEWIVDAEDGCQLPTENTCTGNCGWHKKDESKVMRFPCQGGE